MKRKPAPRQANNASETEGKLTTVAPCLRQGCFICIEHAPDMAPRFTAWRQWGETCCFQGDMARLCTEIDRCKHAHDDHHIRLNINDYSAHSRFVVSVHDPDHPRAEALDEPLADSTPDRAPGREQE
ncbi:MAG: ribulose bisphosphate carboxylase small subunit [Gammaproteobacteria bacterium]